MFEKLDLVNIIDSITTVMQCTLFILGINYCLEEDKKSLKELGLYIVINWILVTISYKLVGNSSLNIIITHIISLCLPYLAFKKNFFNIIIVHTIIYFLITINLLVFSNVFWGIISLKLDKRYIEFFSLVFLYLPQIIMIIIILNNLDKFKRIYKIIISKNFSSISFVILTLILDFLISFNLIVYGNDNPVYTNVIFILLSIFFISVTLYFANNQKKSNEIYRLNRELEEKIVELRKIKHDYGSQISYLYALHLMKNHDRLGELLKQIIDEYNNVLNNIQISNKSDSIISNIISSIDTKNTHVIIDEQIKSEDLPFEEIELQRIFTNIINNAVTAMNGIGNIYVRTYYDINTIVISIENDGPKIDNKIINNIFEAGVSTKRNNPGNHGYGLCIVKEIVESKEGKIKVFSNKSKTEFKIFIPWI